MSKLEGTISFDGTFHGITTVQSTAYGKHIRKARTRFTLGDQMKASSALMLQANVYAKAFKDVIDPYRRDFRDGQLWQRLVSIFKKQLKENGKADLAGLELEELNKIHPLSYILSTTTMVTQADNMLNINVTSRPSKNTTIKERADGYQQTLIIVFADKDLHMQTFSERTIISIKADPGVQDMQCPIPSSSTTAIIILKCDFSKGGKPMSLQKGMGMRVERVVEVAVAAAAI